jgi:hypothetical protein
MDFSKHLFRCSSLGHIMVGSKEKSDPLGESCKAHLVDVFVSQKYGRQTEIVNKYVEKGLAVEEDAITLYSRVNKTMFFKNDERLTNNFIQGEPDLFIGKEIRRAHTIIDVKSSWDLFTFNRVRTKPLNKLYYWQAQGYMALTGAKNYRLAYCLINTPEIMIQDEVRKMMWKMAVTTEDNPIFQEAREELEKSMRYDDIPMNERIIEFNFERNDRDIEAMYNKIGFCRKYLNGMNQNVKYTPTLDKAQAA